MAAKTPAKKTTGKAKGKGAPKKAEKPKRRARCSCPCGCKVELRAGQEAEQGECSACDKGTCGRGRSRRGK